MSWSPIEPAATGNLRAAPPPVSVSTSAGKGQRRPKIYITLRPGRIEGAGWIAAGAGVTVDLGHGEHAGMIRITPGGVHRLGRAANERAGERVVHLLLPMLPGLAPARRGAVPADHVVRERAIEITLPRWAGIPAPKPGVTVAPRTVVPAPVLPRGSMERGTQLAAEAAAAARARAAGAR